jgi:non-heme chloroperoxidase
MHGDSDQIAPFEVSGKRSHEAISGSELVVGALDEQHKGHASTAARVMLVASC